ncbi:CoxG family protein [Paraburkholderia caballeronis]|uniref:Carbon monoxide dehydrogenase subunit G n=1 Tax=Paraburkholderia caballeronis TaxID=416943 RepID=A0A1H7PSY3_9BURK|nr:SRPBCC domain-containing protein [Paraburkholderia caballeronis]PXW24306.1 carbon monoxide dehydrogenase subunit G [Paraburkholderia caballeronis]PXX00088.1 carbon monoxide dehydrogenase subunit G [Paraburkholderia caballeronis]RAJ97217.1 carbon monoxide dehydrogenase subunit G [Paraburkholderia caballeronis]SEB69089.1 Carbon monoxide dehydrogenase subunit G [Paraburkholderia caballeronis]SEL38365.1 Carbon monoxide dehydrogenase subunit G [Paraburkholderia caballeronis]
MELNDALRIPLAPSVVWDALQDAALVRASFAHCESFHRLSPGEYALTFTVPLGPLRARYEVRAHIAHDVEQPLPMPQTPRRILSFRARADGIGSLRGQIDVALRAEEDEAEADGGQRTRIDYSVWATLTGPLAELPPRQIENALHGLADDFFTEFCAVVEAKHGQGPNRVSDAPPRRQHVFLRPISMAGIARRAHLLPGQYGNTLSGRAAGMLPHEPTPHAVPYWAWAAMIFFVALLLYFARRLTS